MNYRKHVFIFHFFLILLFIFCFFFSADVFAGLFDTTPKLVSKLNDAFESIEKWLLTLSTPAAAVAVGVRCFYEKV